MEPEELDNYIQICSIFSGNMNNMGNSIDIAISQILEELGCDLRKSKMLGGKIGSFAKRKTDLSPKYSGNFDDLVEKLENFNKNWINIKHGTIVGNLNSFPTFHKDGIIYGFDPIKIKEINSEFTEIISSLSEISNRSQGQKA
jgi:hypothetical protein